MTKTDAGSARMAQIAAIAKQKDRDVPTDPPAEESKKTDNPVRRKWRAHYSDLCLSGRFAIACKDLRFVEEYGYWRMYDPTTGVWRQCAKGVARGIMQKFLEAELKEAVQSKNLSRLDEAAACASVHTARRVLDWVEPQLTVSKDDFDAHKDLLVVANGVVDLRTSELLPFDAALLLTQRISYPFVAGATDRHCASALASLPDDAQKQFQVMAGQALTGHQPSRSTLFFLWGDGANGKSTLVDLLKATAGDYGKNPPRSLLLKGGSESNFHTIHFKGARQALIEELPDERFLDGGVVRELAGTTTMTGEHKGKDLEEFEVQATIFITFNNRPQVSETAHGVWRRLKLFPLPYTYVETPAEVCSPLHRLQDKIMKDLHVKSEQAVVAFLAWRIEGARQWYAEDRTDPEDAESVRTATQGWRTLNDPLATWFSEELQVDPNSFILVDDLLDNFNLWRNMPRATWGKPIFLDRLTSHVYFRDNKLSYKQAARHSMLIQSIWRRPNAPDWDSPREAKVQCTYIEGVRFRDSSDDVVIPRDASELVTAPADDIFVNEEV